MDARQERDLGCHSRQLSAFEYHSRTCSPCSSLGSCAGREPCAGGKPTLGLLRYRSPGGPNETALAVLTHRASAAVKHPGRRANACRS